MGLPACPAHVLRCIQDMEEVTHHPAEESEAPLVPPEPLPPIESRFLFVDVAALRAKQLRKGARPRLEDEVPQHHKAERVAMEEVRRGLVYYNVPANRPPSREPGA
jgi:DNA-directed RNA polymerase omega subunit